MKFILTIYVCSFIDFTCSVGVDFPKKFNTWSECTDAALYESKVIIESLPPPMVEANRLATKYTCTQIIGTPA